MIGKYLEKMFSLEGKTAIVTGAAGGIGSALAKGLHGAGANVALCDINMEVLEGIKKELGDRVYIFKLDMLDISSFDDKVKEIAKISASVDILVNCAGINKREGITHVNESDFDLIMDINLKGAFFLSQAALPHMKAHGASIINIGSHNTGSVLGGVSVYGASKSGLLSLTRSMAVEWAVYNIRANCISPGHIKTELTTATWEHPERSKYLLDRIAMNRPGYPEDIVGLTIFLASNSASYITGAEYRIDGGCIAGGQPWVLESGY